jgi:hypothetical protein
MKRILQTLSLLICATAFAATGDVVSGIVHPNGWVLTLRVNGLAASGTYSDLGWKTNSGNGWATNYLGSNVAERLVLRVTSPGSGPDLRTNPVVRLINATKPVRRPYPNETLRSDWVDSGDVVLNFSLEEWVGRGDVVTVSVPAGAYTAGGTPNSIATGLSVTNGSTMPYFRVVGNHTWPGWLVSTSSIIRPRFYARHPLLSGGNPVQGVCFTITDGTTTVTNWQWAARVDPNMPDANRVSEYIGELDCSTLTGTNWTQRTIAFPLVGDPSSSLDTGDGVNTNNPPTPLYTMQSWHNGSVFKRTHARVSASGSDQLGWAVPDSYWATNTAPPAFATLNGAAHAVYGTNLANYGRGDIGGAFFEMEEKAGGHTWSGGTASVGSEPSTWVTIRPAPGAANVVIGPTVSGSKTLTSAVKFEGVTVTNTSGTMFSGLKRLWFDRCTIGMLGSASIDYTDTIYWTDNDVQTLSQGFKPYSIRNTAHALIRGNRINGTNCPGISGNIYTVIGNRVDGESSTFAINDQINGSLIPPRDNCIIAHNSFLRGNVTTSPTIQLARTNIYSHGMSIDGNVIENAGKSVAVGLWIAADQCWKAATTNIMVVGNTLTGCRINWCYEDTAGQTNAHNGNRLVGNVVERAAWKGDSFSTDAANTNSWSVAYSVGFSGNVFTTTTNATIDIGNTVWDRPYGDRAIYPWDPNAVIWHQPDWIGFFNPMAYGVPAPNLGGGDYRLLDMSPAHGFAPIPIGPYDLSGTRRGWTNVNAGAYAHQALNYEWPLYLRDDGFEGGDEFRWTQRYTNSVGLRVTTNLPYSGRYSLHVQLPATNVNRSGYAKLQWTRFPLADPTWVRVMVFVGTNASMTVGQTIELVAFSSPAGNYERLALKRTATGYTLRSTGCAADSSAPFTLGAWHEITGRFKSGSGGSGEGEIAWFCDGWPIISGTGKTLTDPPSQLAVGILSTVNGTTYPDSILDCWFDDATADGRVIESNVPAVRMIATDMRSRFGAPVPLMVSGANPSDSLSVTLVTPTSTNTLTNVFGGTFYTYRLNLRGLPTNVYTLRASLLDAYGNIRARDQTTWVKNYAGNPRMGANEWGLICITNTPVFVLGNFCDWQDRMEGWVGSNIINVQFGADFNDKSVAGQSNVAVRSAAVGVPFVGGMPLPRYGGTSTNESREVIDTNIIASFATNLSTLPAVFGFSWLDEPTLYNDSLVNPNGYSPEKVASWWATSKQAAPGLLNFVNHLGDNIGTDTDDRVRRGWEWAWPYLSSDYISHDTYPYYYTNSVAVGGNGFAIEEFADRNFRMRNWNLGTLPVNVYVQPFGIYTNLTGSLSGITRSGTTATALIPTPHSLKFWTGGRLSFYGANESGFNVNNATITMVDANTIQYQVANSGPTTATGSPRWRFFAPIPTTNQVEHMVWLAAACGNAGVNWFPQHEGMGYWNPEHIDNIRRVGTKVRSLERAIASDPVSGFYTSRDRATFAGHTAARCGWLTGTNWIVAANTGTNGTESVTFYGPWVSGEAVVNWETGRTLTAGNGYFTDTIPAEGWRIYWHRFGSVGPITPPSGTNSVKRATNTRVGRIIRAAQ